MTASAPDGWRRLQFSPETFGPELFALCRRVPGLDHLLCRLHENHAPLYPEDRVLRTYQRDLALHGRFALRLLRTDIVLRSGHAVMLPDKTMFFGIEGRRDLLLAAAGVGFTLPLCSVVLPEQRTVVNLYGPLWNVDESAAQQALALLAGVDIAGAAPSGARRVAVTGDANYAHHLWNQLGALEALLARCDTLDVVATHQPIAPIADIFSDHPGLTVTPIAAAELPRLDPRRALPFGVAGRVVTRSVRERVLRIAARRASPAVQRFIAATAGQRLIWLTLRAEGRTALNQFDALRAIAESLLRGPEFAIVLDGYSRPDDYARNRDHNRRTTERAIAHEQAIAHALVGDLAQRLGAAVQPRIFVGVGCDLLDSIHLAAQCRAYFAHHGTLQHKIGYFTTVPGLVHANPGILAGDPAGGHRHVLQDPGVVEYIEPALVEDAVAPGAAPLDPNNAYRFRDIPALVGTFRDFLVRQGVA